MSKLQAPLLTSALIGHDRFGDNVYAQYILKSYADQRIKELETELDKCRSDHLNAMIPPDGHYAKIMKLEAENAELKNRKKR
jgi:hypothetical protein